MVRLFGWVFIIVSFGMLYWWQPEFFQQAYGIIEHGDIIGLAEYLRSFGSWSILVTVLLFIIMTFTIVFPFMMNGWLLAESSVKADDSRDAISL